MSEGAGVESGGDGVTVGGGRQVGDGGRGDHKSGGSRGSCDDSQQDEDLR